MLPFAIAQGVAWALRDAGYQVPGVTIDIKSDLPAGAGLSSDPAIALGIAAVSVREGLESWRGDDCC